MQTCPTSSGFCIRIGLLEVQYFVLYDILFKCEDEEITYKSFKKGYLEIQMPINKPVQVPREYFGRFDKPSAD